MREKARAQKVNNNVKALGETNHGREKERERRGERREREERARVRGGERADRIIRQTMKSRHEK